MPASPDLLSFELDGRPVVVTDTSPTTTLLQWLRASGRTGTKEGCAEGDCGACTVAIADPVSPDGEATWRAVNSCLVLMPMVHGRRVVTVEGLRGERVRGVEATYHPVQEALVQALGSQCGYCTPGVVMSMFEACYRRDLGPNDDARLDDQMCGNLCRCTGYRPIRDATRSIAGMNPEDRFQQALQGAPGASPVRLVSGAQTYVAPADLPGLFAALAELPDARIVSGATDLGLDVTKKHRHFPALISVEAIPELRRIERLEGGWRVGATVLLSDLEAFAADTYPLLAQMLRWFASRQIKNRATLGGNLCNASPIGDTPPVLLALGATAVIAGRSGERRVSFDEFFVGYRKTALQPGEILVAVEIPDLRADQYAVSYKVSKRRELDISAVACSFVVSQVEGVVTEARLAFGGLAATPRRAFHAETALIGRTLDEAGVGPAIAALAEDFQPIGDHRGSAWYRMTVAQNLLRRFAAREST